MEQVACIQPPEVRVRNLLHEEQFPLIVMGKRDKKSSKGADTIKCLDRTGSKYTCRTFGQVLSPCERTRLQSSFCFQAHSVEQEV